MVRNIWHKIKEFLVFISTKPENVVSLDDCLGTFKNGSVQIFVSSGKTIYIMGTRQGIVKFFSSLSRMFQGLSLMFGDHTHLETWFDEKGDSLLAKGSLPVALCLSDVLTDPESERKEVKTGRVAFRYYGENYGIEIIGTREGLKDFSLIIIEKMSKKIIPDHIHVNEIEIDGTSIITNDSPDIIIKIVE
ncbi:MAG: hypothetical protein K8T10_13900 [Candidatus Eremiobacteraeota bacterium]|nr:hypothetical protein [Candidatus Eremiobacteraeota bacterium]